MLQYIRIRELGDFKMFLYKKCEVCGNNINKLQSIWNIYTLKIGETIQCNHCGTYYQTNKTIQTLASMYVNLGLGLILWLILGICVNICIHSLYISVNKNISMVLSLIISFVLLGCINCIIACVIPLHKTQTPKEKRKKPLLYWLCLGLLAIVLIVFVVGFLGVTL